MCLKLTSVVYNCKNVGERKNFFSHFSLLLK